MKYRSLLAAAPLVIIIGCGGGGPSSARRVVQFGQFRCTQPGEDVRKETTVTTNLSIGIGVESSSSVESSSESTTATTKKEATFQEKFLSILSALKDAKVETGTTVTRKNDRIARLAGRGAELEVITYKLCEAAGNGLLRKSQYERFLELTLQ